MKTTSGGVWHAHGFAWAWLVALLSIVLSLAATPARAGGPLPPELEFEWASVRAKNNENWVGHRPHLPPIGPPVVTGAVKYNYRIAKTPVTNGQWLEFVVAYDKQFGFPGGGSLFLGTYIVRVGSEYLMQTSVADFPVRIGWRYAAIYTNWLHNGKAATPEAFQSGAYDVSTFGQDADGWLTDQRTRSPGAQYWIPSSDEWVKSMHYDPNRYGEGESGYWLHPGMQDTPLTPGLPQDGGQSNVGTAIPLNVGSYPHVQSPWGVLDTSGGEMEWMEDYGRGSTTDGRAARLSSHIGETTGNIYDHISMNQGLMLSMRAGFRVAAVVPAPGSAVFAPLTLFLLVSRRARRA